MSETEKRALACEVRAEIEEGQPARIIGHGAVFNKRSEMIMGLFKEEIAPGAFDDVLGDDVLALFNHDANFVLGRTRSSTLALSIDAEGLRYEITPPDTQTVRDLVLAPLSRGDLLDVSPVTYPAYPDAGAAARSLEARCSEIKGLAQRAINQRRARERFLDIIGA